jgi:CRISPR-associated endonuclease Cas3-HD
MVLNELIAKSDGTSLIDHLELCASKCKSLSEKLNPSETNLNELCYMVGLFHDVGKCFTSFQNYLFGNSKQCDLLHNEISYILISRYLKFNNENDFRLVLDSILFHHPFNSKMNQNEVFKECDIEISIQLIKYLLNKLNKNTKLSISFNNNYNSDNVYHIEPQYIVDDIYGGRNSKFMYINTILKFGDILTSNSSISENDVVSKENNIIFNQIVKPVSYDDRFEIQKDYAINLMKYQTSMFESQTGFGKTMLGLLYLLFNNKKGYWVCPRNTIAFGLYETIKSELRNLGLNGVVKVGLLLGGEWVEGDEKSDIIVTNIDNFVNPMFNTKSNLRTYNMLHCNCIFDEFHEYLSDSAIMACFDLIIKMRKLSNVTKTLLLSATPINNLFKPYVDNDTSVISYNCDLILNKKIKIVFNDEDVTPTLKNKNYLISTNTVSKTQNIYTKGVVDNILHARYLDVDKDLHFKQLFSGHSKGVKCDNSSWVANNVISTGVDVSFGNLILHWVTPEKLLQTGGRCNRWGECEVIPEWVISLNQKDINERRGVGNFYDVEIVKSFNKFLKQNLSNDTIVDMGKLYDLRYQFYLIPEIKQMFNRFYTETLRNSYVNLSKLTYNYSNKIDGGDVKYISNKPNIRSENNLNNYNFFIVVNLDGGGKSDAIRVDNQIIDVDGVLSSKDNLNDTIDMIKKLEPNIFRNYFKSKRHLKNLENNPIKFVNHLKKLATKDNTPWIVMNGYRYNREVGLYRDK